LPPSEAEPKGFRLRRKGQKYKGFGVGASYRIERVSDNPKYGFDGEGRCWERHEDGTLTRLDQGASSAEKKRAFTVRQNIEGFVGHYEHNRCGMLTLTALGEDDALTPREFARIWNRMTRRDLEWIRSYVRVLEIQLRGAPHYHLLVATPFDLKPGEFPWEGLAHAQEVGRARGFKSREYREARAAYVSVIREKCPQLLEIWSELRAICKRYGLGRSEFLPFKKEAGAVAFYVGKYLAKGDAIKRPGYRGARRFECDRTEARQWKRVSSVQFDWNSEGAAAFRKRKGELAAAVGVSWEDEESGKKTLSMVLGRRWGYNWKDAIMTLPDDEWYQLLEYEARENCGAVPDHCYVRELRVGGQLVATWDSREGYSPSGAAEPESPAKG
jgi:hypothetical protein